MRAFTIAALSLLTACSVSQMRISGPSAPSSFVLGRHHDDRNSWMAAGAKTVKRLLYVSDVATNDVFVYNYDTGVQVGQLTGFNYPQGQCVDKNGDVWIANFANGGRGVSVVEYAHGGTHPLAVLVPEGNPIGCSINPKNGRLAVANVTTPGGEPGDIEVWKNRHSIPAMYKNNGCGMLTSPGYDEKGNLYVMGFVDGPHPTNCANLQSGATPWRSFRSQTGRSTIQRA